VRRSGGSTILIGGMLAGDAHQGGATWAVLQYALGLRALGHEVFLVDPVERIEPVVAGYFRRVVGDFDLRDHVALLVRGTHQTLGVPYERLRAAARGADVLLNISGRLRDDELTSHCPVRVYLDLDPTFNQLWHAVEGIDVGFAGHNRFVTVGLALGDPRCTTPTCGKRWITTLPPVFLPAWPRGPEPSADSAFTTVANWRAYGSIDHHGVLYGQKAHSLRRFMALPAHTDERFRLALCIHPDEVRDLEALARNGWSLVDPLEVAGTPGDYADFVRRSKGELGIAKSGYVTSRCGWFSDRSACYLASGRPVVAQETGFSRYLPAGAGLLAFETLEQATAALEEVSRDYSRHARAARAFAEEALDSSVVLRELLERVA
jgi:hypothetical protein